MFLLAGCYAATAAQAADATYEKIDQANGDYRIVASFQAFNGSMLTLAFPLAQESVRSSMDEFGDSGSEIEGLVNSCDGPCTQQQYDHKLLQHYSDHSIRAVPEAGGTLRLFVDVPSIVARNRPRMNALAAKFDELATAGGYDGEETVGAVIAFVQKALAYRSPPHRENGRDIFGFYPPPRSLEAGFGDCDTKSALVAAIMTNFPGTKVVGVHVPKHYLVGIARVPRPGDAYVEYEGEPYVLIEASGPARMPLGTIAETTKIKLDAMQDVRIERLF